MEFLDCTNMENFAKVRQNPLQYSCKGSGQQQGGVAGNILSYYEQHQATINQAAQAGVKFVKDKFGKNPGDTGYVPTPEPTDDGKLLGMPKALTYSIGVVLLVGAVYGVYKLVKK